MMGGLMNNIMGGSQGGGNNIGGDPISNMMGGLMGGMMGNPSKPQTNKSRPKPSDDIDNIINNMNIDPSNIDLDSISIISGDSDNGGLTLNI